MIELSSVASSFQLLVRMVGIAKSHLGFLDNQPELEAALLLLRDPCKVWSYRGVYNLSPRISVCSTVAFTFGLMSARQRGANNIS
jgi:hypothetical protein